jgi:hypothetical protein
MKIGLIVTMLGKKVLFIILILIVFLIDCKKKDEDNVPTNLISWMKPASFRNSPTGFLNLNRSDDGFLVSGYFYSTDTVLAEGFVSKMDSKGDTIWSSKVRIDSYTFNQVFYSVQKSSDEILIAGICSNNAQDRQRFLAWLNADGVIQKSVLFAVPEGYQAGDCKLFPLSDGNIYYATMITDDNLQAAAPVSLLKLDLLDANGRLLRSKDYEDIHTTLDRLSLLDDGNLLLAGTTLGTYPNYSDMIFLLIDNSGNEIHRLTFGSDNYDIGYSACINPSGGYFVAGMLTYASQSTIFPISQSGVVGAAFPIADTIFSSATVFKPSINGGGYDLFIQSKSRFYIIKLGIDLKARKTLWFENPYPSNMAQWPVREIFQYSDDSFAFLYYNDLDGQVILKTVPVK